MSSSVALRLAGSASSEILSEGVAAKVSDREQFISKARLLESTCTRRFVSASTQAVFVGVHSIFSTHNMALEIRDQPQLMSSTVVLCVRRQNTTKERGRGRERKLSSVYPLACWHWPLEFISHLLIYVNVKSFIIASRVIESTLPSFFFVFIFFFL